MKRNNIQWKRYSKDGQRSAVLPCVLHKLYCTHPLSWVRSEKQFCLQHILADVLRENQSYVRVLPFLMPCFQFLVSVVYLSFGKMTVKRNTRRKWKLKQNPGWMRFQVKWIVKGNSEQSLYPFILLCACNVHVWFLYASLVRILCIRMCVLRRRCIGVAIVAPVHIPSSVDCKTSAHYLHMPFPFLTWNAFKLRDWKIL